MAHDHARHHKLLTERKYLEEAKAKASEQLDLVTDLYRLDEELDGAASEGRTRLAEVQEQIMMAQKQIQELETPRDDSLDNSVSGDLVFCAMSRYL